MAGTTADIVRFTNATGDGLTTTAGNWIIVAGTPSTPPAAGEKAVINTLSAGNINAADQSTLTLGELEIEQYPGVVGVGGNPWQINATVLKINARADVNLSGTFGTVLVEGTGAGTFRAAAGDITNLTQSAGTVIVDAACAIAKDGGESVTLLGGTLRLRPNANAVTLITQQAGSLHTERSFAAWDCDGGMAYLRLNTAGTTLTGRGGARIMLETAGTLATVHARRCEINDLSSPYDTVITTLNEFQPTSNIRLKDRAGSVGTDNLIGVPGGGGGTGA